jgi:hypothetical protein
MSDIPRLDASSESGRPLFLQSFHPDSAFRLTGVEAHNYRRRMTENKKKKTRRPSTNVTCSGQPSEPAARSALDPASVQALFGDDATPLLRSLGLVKPNGAATADAHRKLKQIHHLMRLLEPALQDAFDRHEYPVLVDFGAGKSALSLVLASAWPHRLGRGELIVVEQRLDLMQKADAAAKASGMFCMQPVPSTILNAALPDRIHFAFALHACDTATDHAIVRAIRGHADHIAVVPCCQAELYRQLDSVKSDGGLTNLWHRPWHRREFGAHLTNVIRMLTLQSLGYQVTVTELAGWEHSVKNELIIARKVARFHRGARAELDALLQSIPVRPWLVETLFDSEQVFQMDDEGSAVEPPDGD